MKLHSWFQDDVGPAGSGSLLQVVLIISYALYRNRGAMKEVRHRAAQHCTIMLVLFFFNLVLSSILNVTQEK